MMDKIVWQPDGNEAHDFATIYRNKNCLAVGICREVWQLEAIPRHPVKCFRPATQVD